MKNQQLLNEYFNTQWKDKLELHSLEDLKYSGPALITKINPGESVIDVGCGMNYFKDKIPNLIGIDPAFEEADFKVTVEDFDTDERFDVAFCLGSINFGDEKTIERQIAKVNSLLKQKARIYWRCNPGLFDHDTESCTEVNFFMWNEDWIHHFAAKFGFKVATIKRDVSSVKPEPYHRLYAEWVR
jgi:hypothetical protein